MWHVCVILVLGGPTGGALGLIGQPVEHNQQGPKSRVGLGNGTVSEGIAAQAWGPVLRRRWQILDFLCIQFSQKEQLWAQKDPGSKSKVGEWLRRTPSIGL